MKVHPVRAELFRAGRQTDRHDEANSHFLQFREPAWNDCSSYLDITIRPGTAPKSAVMSFDLQRLRKARCTIKCRKQAGLLLFFCLWHYSPTRV